MFISTSTFCQIVTGKVIDYNSRKSLKNAEVFIEGTLKGSNTDSTGKFYLNLEGNKSIGFYYITFPYHRITNLPLKNLSDTLDLGEIELVHSGFSGYVTQKKKKFLSKKTKLVCKYVDTKRNLNQEERTIRNQYGEHKYTWVEFEKDKFEIKFNQFDISSKYDENLLYKLHQNLNLIGDSYSINLSFSIICNYGQNFTTTTQNDLKLHAINKFIAKFPNSKFELSIHSDCQGSEKYNQKLTEKRGKLIYHWFKENGDNSNRIKIVGKGEKYAINDCDCSNKCTESLHKENRRIELKIVK